MNEEQKHDQVKQLAEQFRLKAHLASMEAKTLWAEELEPRLRDLDHKFDEATRDFDIAGELSSIEKKLRKLLEDVVDND